MATNKTEKNENEDPKVEKALAKDAATKKDVEAKSFEQRAADASIGLVEVDGIGLQYIGVAPAREIADGGKPMTPGGLPITGENSTFQPLANAVFHPSVKIKDPKSGEFYYPKDGITSYEMAEYEGNYLLGKGPK